MELLAQAAAKASAPMRPDQVDETRMCGSPGKIVDVGILDQLLKLPPENQVYYGPGEISYYVMLPNFMVYKVRRFTGEFTKAVR